MQALYTPDYLESNNEILEDEEYDVQALEALGLIRTERNSDPDSDYEDPENGVMGFGSGGQSTLFLFPEWMTGQAAPNYTEDPMLLNFPSSNDTELLIQKPMMVNLGT